MSITSAMYTGVSGLLSNAQALSVIGNNIANVNTTGFKSGRTIFADMLSNMYMLDSQIGTGAQLQAVKDMFSQGSAQQTSSVTDLSIAGSSFFALKEPSTASPVLSQSDAFLSRAGAFSVDNTGTLVNPNGFQVLDTQGNPIRFSDNAQAIQSAARTYATIAATSASDTRSASTAANTTIATATADTAALLAAANAALTAANGYPSGAVTDNIIALANAAITAAANAQTSANTAVTDAGNLATLSSALTTASSTLTAVPGKENAATTNGANIAASSALSAASSSGTAYAASLNAVVTSLQGLSTAIAAAGHAADSLALNTALDPFNSNLGGGTAGTKAADATANALAATNSITTASASNQTAATGYQPVATAVGKSFAKIVSIQPNGLITYMGQDGVTQLFYNASGQVGVPVNDGNAAVVQRLAVVQASDPSVLQKVGGSLYKAVPSSGVPTGAFSLASNTANATSERIISNSLEASNVDMANEFVNMILTQRAYSASSKTITTTDQMTQEVLGLIR